MDAIGSVGSDRGGERFAYRAVYIYYIIESLPLIRYDGFRWLSWTGFG